jgi:hypothetical protein
VKFSRYISASSRLRRDTARRIAQRLQLPTRFIESLRGVTFDSDGYSMLVRGEVDGRTTCIQAIPTLGQRVAPLVEGKGIGLWPVCQSVVEGAPLAIITNNLRDACDVFQAGAAASMLVGDPHVLSKMTHEEWFHVLEGSLARTICSVHGGAACIGVSGTDSLMSANILGSLLVPLRQQGYAGTVAFLDHAFVAGARKTGQSRESNLRDLFTKLAYRPTMASLGNQGWRARYGAVAIAAA